MEDNKFTIKKRDNKFTLQKTNQVIEIWQSSDNDIWFETKEDKVEIELDSRSSDFCEFQFYAIFERLMKSIIGRYMLKDAKNSCSSLPSDFIDLRNMTISWHSDGSMDNILGIDYNGETIKVSITKDKKDKISGSNKVRVRTNGSDYGTYYQEIIRFFKDIEGLYFILNAAQEKKTTPIGTTPTQPLRKLSLKRFLPQKKQ